MSALIRMVVMEMQILVSSIPSFFPPWLPNTLGRVTKPQDTQRPPWLFSGHFPDGTGCCNPLYWDSQSRFLSQQKEQWTNTKKSSWASTWTSTFRFIFHKSPRSPPSVQFLTHKGLSPHGPFKKIFGGSSCHNNSSLNTLFLQPSTKPEKVEK